MAQIASEDYPNKLIYLHIDTVTSGWDPALMQQEHRALRRIDAGGERKFDPMVTFVGNDAKGGGKFTPYSTRLRAGVRIVPYDTGAATEYSLTIENEILNIPDGLADRGVLDRSGVSANVDADKGYDPVEVIEVTVGGGVGTVQEVADAVWDASAVGNNDPGTTGEALNNAGAAGNPWSTLVSGNTDAGTFGELVNNVFTKVKNIINLILGV